MKRDVATEAWKTDIKGGQTKSMKESKECIGGDKWGSACFFCRGFNLEGGYQNNEVRY